MTAGDGASPPALPRWTSPPSAVDGNDVLAVHAAGRAGRARCAAAAARGSCMRLTYRVKGHVSVDPAAYRDPEELKAALATDPIARARTPAWRAAAARSGELDAIERAAADEVEAAVAAADAAPGPTPPPPTPTCRPPGAGWQ